jgi:hypothetical protein
MATLNTNEPVAAVVPKHHFEGLVFHTVRTSNNVIGFATLW